MLKKTKSLFLLGPLVVLAMLTCHSLLPLSRSPYQRSSSHQSSPFIFHPCTIPAPIMASNLVELVNEYYEARKPYTQMVREAHASLPSKNSSKANASTVEANDMAQSQSEPQFSLSPKIPHDEIKDVLEKLKAARIECVQGEKTTGKASVEKKGKAPVKGK